jgi:hypothetical protein
VSRLWSAPTLGVLDRDCTSQLNRMRFGHWVVLQLGNRAPCAALPPPKAPPSRRGAVGAVATRPPTRQHGRSLRERSPVLLCGLRASFCDAQRSSTILQDYQPLFCVTPPPLRDSLGTARDADNSAPASTIV